MDKKRDMINPTKSHYLFVVKVKEGALGVFGDF
jgi:hypothetical protein